MTTDGRPDAPTAPRRDASAFAERVFAATLGTFEVLSIYVGDRLGWYRALVEAGPLDAPALAARTGTHERYAREWLEQQAVYGILTVDEPDAAASARRFALPTRARRGAHRPRLARLRRTPRAVRRVDRRAPRARCSTRIARAAGCRGREYGEDARDAQGDINRPWFLRRLGACPRRRARDCTRCSRARAPGSPTSAAATAGRRSRSRRVPRGARRGLRRRRGVGGRGAAARRRGGRRRARALPRRGRRGTPAGGGVRRRVRVRGAARHAAPGGGALRDPSSREARRPRRDHGRGRRPRVRPRRRRRRARHVRLQHLRVPARQPLDARVGRHGHRHAASRRSSGYAREAGFSGIEVLPIEDFAAFRFTRLLL